MHYLMSRAKYPHLALFKDNLNFMLKVLFFLSILFFSLLSTVAQDKGYVQPSAIGVHFRYNIFRHPESSGASSLNNGVAGLAINYQKGLSRHLDFNATMAGSILDFITRDQINIGNGQKLLLLELDAVLRYKLVANIHTIVPFIQTGLGISDYSNYYGAFFPVGIGFQINLSPNTFILLNAQNRLALSNNQDDHFCLSVGLAGNIGKRKKDTPKHILPAVVAIPQKDTDGDGIIDTEDACPTVAGILKYKGCPVPDRDGDGINDEVDKCPDVPGVLRYQGCPVPDRDKDGLNDERDKCPDDPGPISNQGCPLRNIDSMLNRAARNCFFATGSSALLPASFPTLNQVAQVLQRDSTLHLMITGHTDNIGRRGSNQRLSENRAKAVLDYLVSKGISPTHLNSAGFGDTRPIADNRTTVGRASNRRVEIKIGN